MSKAKEQSFLERVERKAKEWDEYYGEKKLVKAGAVGTVLWTAYLCATEGPATAAMVAFPAIPFIVCGYLAYPNGPEYNKSVERRKAQAGQEIGH